MIYVEPESGLCNRFRVIDSAIQLAKFRKTKVKVIWKVNHDVGAEFLSLFEKFPPEYGIVELHDDFKSGYYDIGYHRQFTRFKKFFKPGLIDLPDWEEKEMFKKYEDIYLQFCEGRDGYSDELDKYIKHFWDKHWPGKRYYIRTYSRFFGNPRNEYKMFKPVKEIIADSEKLIRHFNGTVTGVHIRRTDSVDAIKASPTHKYIEEMEKEVHANPATKFFLATDSADERNILAAHFKDRILFHQSTLERGNSQGMKDALTELYCLSKTNKIIGSYSSSFTETAVYYNAVKPYKIIK